LKSFLENVSSFLDEDGAKVIGIYAVFAIVACGIVGIIEFYNQTSSIAISSILIKSGLIALLGVVCFSVIYFIFSWYSDILGGEISTIIILVLVWLLLIYKINLMLISWLGLSFENLSYYTFLHLVALLCPFFIGLVFLLIRANAWKN
jgi:hypothetical protein